MRVGPLTFTLAACLAASPALAENWRASSHGQGIMAFIDVDSIRKKGDRVTFWRELRFPEVRSLSSNVRYDKMAAYYEADCKAMTLRSLKIRVSLGEQVVFRHNGKDDPQAVLPGSTAEIDLRSACHDDWPKAEAPAPA
jgi:hypothetical protein